MSRFSMSVLRAFDAVGRNSSFSKAAVELGISQSAISRHVASLELDLNCRLLERTTRQCSLTSEGRTLFLELSEGLRQIDSAIANARRRTVDDVLNVSVSPFLSVAWFTPRLLNFIKDNPDLDIRLTHSYEPPMFDEGKIDVGVNWSLEPNHSRTLAELIISGALVPVCSPRYAREHLPTSDVHNLLRCNLFHEFKIKDWWDWFAAYGVSKERIKSQQISDTSALRQTALSDGGVCLLFEALIQDDISSGRLVSPFASTVHSGEDYWLTYPVEHASRPALKRFVRWLRGQSTKTANIVQHRIENN
ncbi:LysR substrate-binding domain-containing protein [uncultured Roseibium sp.]|uniref:LysR substrate-binding domain-containing protein n=1 Tax=uncultured Roseibium sp. TaxID=1936171 RepID=UPI002639F2E0|nr:LysR substrate-binding domain-containing protein [uncultured Roseibium sp.]